LNKIQSIFLLTAVLIANIYGQVYHGQVSANSIPAITQHYQDEFLNDTIINADAWLNVPAGLNVSFASTNWLYFRREVPDLAPQGGLIPLLELSGWKGERLNTNILIWSPDTLTQVRVIAGDLKAVSGGNVIKKENINVHMVRYVLSNYPYAATDITCGESPYKGAYLMPDRFENFDRFSLPAKTVRPVWLSVNIPANAMQGMYEGTIEVKALNYSKTLSLKINVQNLTLPPAGKWKFRLDLWQNPWVVAWVNNIEPWSDEHVMLLKEHMKLYADAGGKFITTYAIHSPWADNSYMIEGTMIEWYKQKNGNWKFDYAIFDKWVQLCMDIGIKDAITIYTAVPWGNRFRYVDEVTGNYVYLSLPPESADYKTLWNVFLNDLRKHLEKKGWFNKTYIGINENEMAQTLAAIKVINENSKDWKITYAGNWHEELDSLLDDYCFLYGEEPSMEKVKERSARKATSTYYICCNPPKPNDFVFSPPAEGRWLGWYSAAYGYDGFLRWAYDAWPSDPLRDARHVFWPAGDCFLIYPGGNSGTRFEKLREGISDYEKIRILKEKVGKTKNSEAEFLLQQLEKHLFTLTEEKEFSEDGIRKSIDTGTGLLNKLSDIMAKE
jgi:hypothetical protein